LCAILALLVTHPSSFTARLLPVICLLLVTLAIYAWLLYSIRHSLAVSAAVLVAVGWALAVRPHSAGGLVVGAGVPLMALAAWRKQRQMQRLHRVLERVGTVQEEQAVTAQAIAQAQDARDALQKKLSEALARQEDELDRLAETF